MDAGGVLVTKNQAVLRAETRVGVGVLKPSSSPSWIWLPDDGVVG
ncbi:MULTISPECIES: hypothetical protein [Mycolicibacterium]|nr:MULTISPECIES: hypothetical protein [Mycolicibacterium]